MERLTQHTARPHAGPALTSAVISSVSSSAASLMDLLALSEDELCTVLATDPLTLVSGQADGAPELRILLDLLQEPTEAIGPTRLRLWLRANGPHGRPIDLLLARDFAAFEDALDGLSGQGFVIRASPDR